MEVNCIECGTKFEFKTTSVTVDGVDVIFAECPKCGQRYISYVVDKEVKESFKKTKHQLKRSRNMRLSFAKRQKASRKHKSLTQENRRLMEQKKAEYQHIIHKVIENAEF